VLVGYQGAESTPHTVYALAFKAPLPAGFRQAASAFEESFRAKLKECSRRRPWGRKVKWGLLGWTRGKGERRREREYFQARFILTNGGGSPPAEGGRDEEVLHKSIPGCDLSEN
jgi:hypothetical protein